MLCECGCHGETSGRKGIRFIRGHHRKGNIPWNKGIKNPYKPESLEKMRVAAIIRHSTLKDYSFLKRKKVISEKRGIQRFRELYRLNKGVDF